MQELMTLANIKVENKATLLFEIKELAIKEGSVVGVVGKNGSGKSTLLSLIKGEKKEFQGNLTRRIELDDISYVKQEEEMYQETASYSSEVKHLFETFTTKLDYQQLSGGEKLKRRLKVSLSNPKQLLLLDEPTNHLDEKSVTELINYIKAFQGTIVLVSHNRYFLDQVTTDIWSIEDHKIKGYKGNYSTFQTIRKEAKLTQERAFAKQSKELKRVKKEMQQLTNWSASAHAQSTKQDGPKEFYRGKAKKMDSQRKSVAKRLQADLAKHQVERVKEDYQVRFELEGTQIKTGPLFLVEDLRKEYGQKVLFETSGFSIMYGDRVAITGENGSGKTTLLKILLGSCQADGKIWRSDAGKIGYLSQEVYDLPVEQRISEFFDLSQKERSSGMTLFVQLGFEAKQWDAQIKTLSMGERVKIKLMAQIIQQKNVLLLDEPTNHLDIQAREQLETVLETYQGTLIFVSHDRYFREKVATRTLVIESQRITEVLPLKEKISSNIQNKLLLEFQRDEWLSKLSVLAPNSQAYQEASLAFDEILNKLKNLKKEA